MMSMMLITVFVASAYSNVTDFCLINLKGVILTPLILNKLASKQIFWWDKRVVEGATCHKSD